jgi:hypothetical protein
MSDYIKSLVRSIDLGFPFVAVTTPDYPDTLRAIKDAATDYGLLHWDMARGAIGVNDRGAEAQAAVNNGEEPAVTTAKFEECLQRMLDLAPRQTVLVMDDVHLMLEHKDETVRALYIQCIRNCRESFKATERCLVFLCPSIKLPSELVNDVEIIDAPLPDEEQINRKTEEICKSVQLEPTDEMRKKVADALLGLTMFSAENAMAKCVGKSGFDYPALWKTKRSYIRQVGCLSVPEAVSSFDQLGGLDYIKSYGQQIIGGKRRPRLVVLLDEIDKWVASLGDSNGINADALGQLLGAMQDYDWDGITLPGFAGTGKTEWAKALGNEAGGMFLQMDLGGAKGGIVGDSERMIRQAIQMLYAMGKERVLFVATCNDMSILQRKPELLRRLAYGINFFDLPTEEEQRPIWDLYLKRFEIPEQDLPSCDGWTGAEIKKVCKLADEFGLPLADVAGRITPVCKTMGSGVDALRDQAEKGFWVSAKTGKPYGKKRSLSLDSVRKIGKAGNN